MEVLARGGNVYLAGRRIGIYPHCSLISLIVILHRWTTSMALRCW